MQESMGRPVNHINQKFSKTLRKVAMDKGIKQTEQGQRLEFYIVTDEEFSQFTNDGGDMLLKLSGKEPVRALISIDSDKMSANLQAVNSKPEYQTRMKYDTHQKYLGELRDAMADAVHKIGEDLNTRKKADAVGENPYKVGDYIYNSELVKADGDNEVRLHFFPSARVVKSGKRFVEIETPRLDGELIWSNSESAKRLFKNTVTWYLYQAKYAGEAHGHFVPEKDNEDAITWKTMKKGYTDKPARFQWNNVPGESLQQVQENVEKRKQNMKRPVGINVSDNSVIHGPGYFYNYEGRD
tara:strand:+ start:65 stop:955 length:891 start_codon:yes stop_codon:yes gene_type:complete